jgi:predicted transcriptional regulator of viral defense system
MAFDLLRTLAREGQIISIDQIAQKINLDRSVLRVLIQRLQKKGYIERIEKGKYLIIPLNSEQGNYTLQEFVIGSCLVSPYAISYWSALHWYGMTEQIPRTVFIQTTARKKKRRLDVFGVDYQIVKIKDEKFFGNRTEWIEDSVINITDKEKTIVDCLDKPQYAGGIIEVNKSLQFQNIDLKKLETYALKMGKTVIIQRLGYLCERLNIPISLPVPKVKSYSMLDPTLPKTGESNSKWKLILNLENEFDSD